LINTKELQEVR